MTAPESPTWSARGLVDALLSAPSDLWVSIRLATNAGTFTGRVRAVAMEDNGLVLSGTAEHGQVDEPGAPIAAAAPTRRTVRGMVWFPGSVAVVAADDARYAETPIFVPDVPPNLSVADARALAAAVAGAVDEYTEQTQPGGRVGGRPQQISTSGTPILECAYCREPALTIRHGTAVCGAEVCSLRTERLPRAMAEALAWETLGHPVSDQLREATP